MDLLTTHTTIQEQVNQLMTISEERFVNEEVGFSEHMQRYGLLAVESKKFKSVHLFGSNPYYYLCLFLIYCFSRKKSLRRRHQE